MTTLYQQELDGRRPEFRPDVANVLRWWPKVDGQNVTVTSATFEVFAPTGGNAIQSGTAAIVAVTTYSRVDATLTAITTKACDYTARFTFRVSGESVDRVHVVSFDVVAWPLEPQVSLNELAEVRPSIGRTLERLGAHLNPVRDAPTMAGVYVLRATIELDSRLRASMQADTERLGAGRPSLILNRQETIDRYLVYAALKLIMRADGGVPGGENQQSLLMADYNAEADATYRAMTPLQYDTTGNNIPDTVIQNRTTVKTMRRG